MFKYYCILIVIQVIFVNYLILNNQFNIQGFGRFDKKKFVILKKC